MSIKSYFLTVIVLCFVSAISAQKPVYLNIEHQFDKQEISFDEAMKYEANNFDFNRVDYYLSEFRLVLSNGDEVALEDSYALVRSSAPISMYLGDTDASEITGLKFSIGIGKDINHEDPAAWPSDHPLNYQDPSMHWGWAGGYIFFVFNGNVDTLGGNPSEFFDFQAIGDEMMRSYEMPLNYGVEENEESIQLNILADYQALLEELPLPYIQHGAGTMVTKMMNNIIDNQMFSEKTPSGTHNFNVSERALSISPNPAQKFMELILEETAAGDRVLVINAFGQIVSQFEVNNQQVHQLQLDQKGIYFVQLIDGSNQLIHSVKQIVID